MKKIISVLLVLICPLRVDGWEKDRPIIWVEEGISLEGRDTFVVLPVTNESGRNLDPSLMIQMQQQITRALKEAGHKVTEYSDKQKRGAIIVRTALLSYKTGDAVGRWIGFGAGAAKCTIRSSLIEGDTNEVIAEIISTKVIDMGGLFTIGADSRIADDVTRDISSTIIDFTQ